MKISEITIKGIHNIENRTYTFSNITYLYGLNGSGKSTILQAIQFCLLGYIPGTAKTTAAIFSHCGNGLLMSAKLTLCNDEMFENSKVVVARKIYKEGSKLIEAVKISPDEYDLETLVGNLELPAFNLTEFLGLSANKQKDLLISIIPNIFQPIQTQFYLQQIPQYGLSCKDIVQDCASTNNLLSTIDDIKQLNVKLKDIQSGLKSEEKRLTSVTQSLIYYDDYEGCTDVEQLQADLNDCLKKRDQVLQYEQKRASYESNIQKLDQYADLSDNFEQDPKYIELNSEILSFEQLFADYFSEQLIIEEKIGVLNGELKKLQPIVNSNGICPYTELNCSSISSQLFKFQKQFEKISNNLIELTEELSELKEKKSKANSDKLDVEKKLSDLLHRYEIRNNLKNLCDLIDTEDFDETSSDLSIRLQQINDSLVKASANAKYNELLESLQKQKLELNAQLEFVKAAIKVTGENGLQSELSSKPFENVKTAMKLSLLNLGITELGQPEFILKEKANSFDFGVMRDDIFIPFEQLSSGEKCIFVLIFLEALLTVSNSSMHFIMIDDLFDHLDESKFRTVIENIRKLYGVQFIIAGVNPVSKEGIRTINVGEAI